MSVEKENVYQTDANIRKLGVVDLRKYLRLHNQYVSGKKSDLIDRAIGIRKIGIEDRESVTKRDFKAFETRSKELLTTPLGESLPEPKSLVSGWSDDPTDIPNFSDADIYNYFVLRMNAKRHLRAKVYYEDGHVYNVKSHPISDSSTHCFVASAVMPSLPTVKIKDSPDHNVWICLAKVTGQVNSADCSCTAGNGETCNHVAALMYALVDISNRKKDGTISATSKKCKWNNPRKRKLSPKKPCQLTFRKHTFENRDLPRKLFSDKVTDNQLPASTVNIESFRLKLEEMKSKAGWLTNFEENPRKSRIPFINRDLKFGDSVNLNSEQVQTLILEKFEAISFTEKDSEDVERRTRGQCKNDAWFEERHWRITSSNFGTIFHKKPQTEPDNIIKNMLYVSLDNKYVRWGRSHEAAARMKYKIQMKKQYKDLRVSECGLLVSTMCPYLAASPDGLVTYSDENRMLVKGLIEIKCPASEKWKNISPEKCAEDPTFCCELKNGKCVLKRKHNYYCQIQGQLAISGRQWCDFIVWTLSGMSVERIYLDSSFWQCCKSKLTSFYINALLPELYSRRIQRGLSL